MHIFSVLTLTQAVRDVLEGKYILTITGETFQLPGKRRAGIVA